MEDSLADQIWNRAALQKGGPSARDGDQALAALLLAHGRIMNGGVHHALESLSGEELAAAKRGYAFFGFHAVPRLLDCAHQKTENRVDRDYAELVPDDSALFTCFEQFYAKSPASFAPLAVLGA